MKKGIIGAGGLAREIYWSLSQLEREECIFFVDEKYYDGKNDDIKCISDFNPYEYEIIIGIGDPISREKIVNSLPENTKYFTHIHPSVHIHDPNIKIGEGSFISTNVILTTNIIIGKHSILNLSTTVGHDTIIGDYFSSMPGVQISGDVTIGNKVYLGTNTSIREKIKICDLVIIGLNSGVVKHIVEPGLYVGTPAIKIK